MKRPNVLIGVPTRGSIFVGAVFFLCQQVKKGHSLFAQPSTLSVEGGRKQIVHYFLKNKQFTHLFWMDDDVTCPDGTIERLICHNRKVISAKYPLYFDGVLASSGYVYKHDKKKFERLSMSETGVKQVDGMGLGACLMDRDSIERIAGKECFRLTYAKNGNVSRSDDFTMCKYLTKEKIPMFCDFDIVCDHYKSESLNAIKKDFIDGKNN